MSKAKVTPLLSEMAKVGLGHFVEVGNKVGLIKKFPLEDTVLEEYGLTSQQYETICKGSLPISKCPETQKTTPQIEIR